MDRRHFFTTAAVLTLPSIALPKSEAEETASAHSPKMAVLIDVTKCIGCRKCEWACNEANHLPTQTLESFETKDIFQTKRRPDAGHYTVVNQYPGAEGDTRPVWVKYQCFHCEHPACYSACLVTAFSKMENGAVVYNPDRCMGCRYCMVACPFQIPAYEYDNPLTPQVRKCTFCYQRTSQDGGMPACVEVCPPQCLSFGPREEVLAYAKETVASHPDQYVQHVYGEHEAGGTSWFYISQKPFEEIGLPTLGNDPPPELTEEIQHGLFRYFIPPVALYTGLGMVATLFEEREKLGDAVSLHHVNHEPMRKKFFTPGIFVLLAFMGVGLIFALWRLIAGLGAVTHLSNQFPWGIWIAIDVASGVALAAGGFTTAALVHVFHSKRYEPVVRSALLTALLGYTFVVLGLMLDLGRYYNIWHPVMPWMWSGHSVLFEVGMCVTFYLTVLYLEFLPIVVERFQGKVNLPGPLSRLNPVSETLLSIAGRTLSKVMFFLILAGVMLSCLHQSSLGALMVIAPYKMHPLWYTPILSALFLLSALCVGFPMVVFESILAARVFHRKPEMDVLTPLSRFMPVLLLVYLTFKVSDLAIREVFPYLLDGSIQSGMFLLEIGVGVIIPLILLCFQRVRQSPRWLFISCTMVVLGVVLNRINVFLVAYTPLYKVTQYSPSVGEIAVTAGLIAALMFIYRVAVTLFPVLPAEPEERG